jgi:hypothetical protein
MPTSSQEYMVEPAVRVEQVKHDAEELARV